MRLPRRVPALALGAGVVSSAAERVRDFEAGLRGGDYPSPNLGRGVGAELGSSRMMGVFLAAAMFVFVIDTSFMNVSISAVVDDLDTTVSGVQAAVAIEALVSASFILISSKLGDLFGRKRAYAVGLLFYIVGALAMVVAQGLTAIIVFWAVIGGLGASLYLPAMQSLIHGNFEGKERAKVFALVGAAGAIAAAVGPLIGGFVTTLLSWRVGFLIEALIIAVVLVGSRQIRDVPYTGDRSVDVVGAFLSVIGMGGLVVGVLVWQEGGEAVAALLAIGIAAMAGLVYWLRRRKREGKAALLDPSLFSSRAYTFGVSQIFLQQLALGGMLIALPIYLQLVWGYNALQAGVTLAPLSLTMFGVAILAGRRAGKRRPASIVRAGFVLLAASIVILIPLVPTARLRLDARDAAGARRRRTGPARVPAQQLRARTHLGGARRRGRRCHLRDGIVRPLVRPRVRGRDHARDALDRLHQHGRVEQRDPAGRPAAHRERARGRRTGDERRATRRAPRRPARGRPGGDPQHQHRRPAPRPSGRAARHAALRARRRRHRFPHDAPTRPSPVGCREGAVLG